MTLTEILSELPMYVVIPGVLIAVMIISFTPVAILNYADRKLKEHHMALIAIILCSLTSGFLFLLILLQK